MPVPRKSEPASSAKTSRDEAKPHLVSIPRAWLIGLAALLIVPWVVVSAIYFLPGGGAPATPAAAPTVADAGPWGHLEITPILVSPPLEYVGADWGGRKVEPDQWKFPGVSRDQLGAFLTTAGFTAAVRGPRSAVRGPRSAPHCFRCTVRAAITPAGV